MAKELVTVARFTYPTEAWLQKLLLDRAGLTSYVADENLVSMNWLYSNAVGGVKLQVAQPDVKAAAKVLRDGPLVAADPEGEFCTDVPTEACPKCSSHEVYWNKVWRRPVFLFWLLFGFPVPLKRMSWGCFACHAWGRLPIQFTLRTLLILTLVVAVVCSLVRTLVTLWSPDLVGPESPPYP